MLIHQNTVGRYHHQFHPIQNIWSHYVILFHCDSEVSLCHVLPFWNPSSVTLCIIWFSYHSWFIMQTVMTVRTMAHIRGSEWRQKFGMRQKELRDSFINIQMWFKKFKWHSSPCLIYLFIGKVQFVLFHLSFHHHHHHHSDYHHNHNYHKHHHHCILPCSVSHLCKQHLLVCLL